MSFEISKTKKDISGLTGLELNKIFYTKDGLRNFFTARGYKVNAEFMQRGDPAEAEDLQKVLDVIYLDTIVFGELQDRRR